LEGIKRGEEDEDDDDDDDDDGFALFNSHGDTTSVSYSSKIKGL
jgi:hypothetical protein